MSNLGFQSSAPFEHKELTSTNGKDINGTEGSTGPYHFVFIDCTSGPSVGATWFTGGIGTATIVVHIGRFSANDERMKDRSPVTNGAWGVALPYAFLNAAAAPVSPDGASTAGNLEIRDVSGRVVMVRLEVGVTIPDFSLHTYNGSG